ncbi:MurR/RpiR family transcriptional regulator [Lactobacillus sp. YT155]|uniref:MurR/RpiR family transcriptional regulator n=1 Tax=Lactobacillus sp. YT155 TaxID=3060955 RepID=UPI00265FD3A2|nr:MurR/RpiR family transcriptional regulator [Lactobacillus sp. YT155]MDO1604491.1 MurR/RpiR family transcriptional regulator [Lactobacillus sp. YT155]
MNKNINIFNIISSHYSSFTPVEEAIADFFINKNKLENFNINYLSKKINTSTSSITRFVKKIGLDNYKELIYLYNTSLEHQNLSSTIRTDIAQNYSSLIYESEKNFRPHAVKTFSNLISKNRYIWFWGLGFNSFAGEDFYFKFFRFGKIITVLKDHHTIFASSHQVKPGDLIIISSLSGQDSSLIEGAKIASEKGATILVITGNEESPLIDYATETIYCSALDSNQKLGQVSPQIPILIQLDIVYSQYYTDHETIIGRKWDESENFLN